ncbi:flagellar filament capping protein FliD [Niallia oryzisoli]|uniref:Flagellar hook-associated protein 2 n=1 Tax=Niallia oryzisoli TaxID=1737571 RepID=A0ABZ2C9U5_9BACI
MANLRISGLASGMDIDSIVSDMMKIKRMPLDKLKQQKQTMEWQRDDYREMNTLLLNFRSELTQMKLSTNYRTRTTTTTDESKVTATATSAAALSSYSIQSVSQLATAATKVNAGKISGSQKINLDEGLYAARDKFSVDKTNFNWQSGSVESKTLKVTDPGNISLELPEVIDIKSISNMSVKVNGVAYIAVTNQGELTDGKVLVDLDTGKLTFNQLLSKESTIKIDYIANKKIDTFNFNENTSSFNLTKGALNAVDTIKITAEGASIPTEYTVNENYNQDDWDIVNKDGTKVGSINRLNGKISMAEGFQISAKSKVDVTYDQKYFNFGLTTYNTEGKAVTESFNILGTESLNNVINKVNSSNVGVSMFYDSFSDKMTLTRTETGNFNGSESDPEIITTGNFINDLLQFGGVTESGGKNAVFTINGLKTERNSNTFAVNGVTFTLKQTFNESESTTATPVTIAINNNNDEIFNNIKSFIEKYNELIGKIQEKTQEERYKSYTPLTDEQREQLSDKQQEQWEEKAKSGLLRRDQTLTSLLSSMRMDFYGKVESEKINPVYSQLASIGIKTTANYLEGGKLEINEAELKKAIEEDPESIEALFNASGTTNSQKGIAQRLYDTVGKTMDILYEKAGKSYSTNNQFTIGKQLNNIDNQIDSLEDRLTALEDRYYRQFTAMEKAIQNANQQSAYITQNFFS